MKKSSEKFLFDYLNTYSPTGFEMEGQRTWLSYLKPVVDEYFTDTYGTAVAVINPGQPYKVVIEAHSDEISWFVHHISSDGYVRVVRNGGSDHQIAPSMRVWFHTKKGLVPGVFGWPAIHVRKAKEDNPSLDNIFIDCGCDSKAEVEELGIHIGTVVTFVDGLMKLNKNYYTGRALDNRMGGFMIAEVAHKLKEKGIKLPYTLYIVNAVQEEVGLRGAQMIAHKLKPDVAICTDVNHCTTSPMYDSKKQSEIHCGKGPTLSYAPAVHNNLRDMMIEVAEKEEIPFQRQAHARGTGTDTDAFSISGDGIPAALISLPLKYMHTTVETAHKDDIKNSIKLLYKFLEQLPNNHDFTYKIDV